MIHKNTRRGNTQVVNKDCHSRRSLSGIYNACPLSLRNDRSKRFRTKYAVAALFNNGGFTLIELLVVVLIIGVLAAVAVPQYQKVVYKARTTQAVVLLKSIIDAQEIYYLTHGKYADSINDLDIGIDPSLITTSWLTPKFDDKYSYGCTGARTCGAFIKNASMPTFEFHTIHIPASPHLSGKKWCEIQNKNNTAKSICASMGTLDDKMGENYYKIN